MSETVPSETIIPKERVISSNTSPGLRLKRAREMAKLSLTVVARQLYLSENVINALEKDQYEKLPGLTFAKGYLRAYAKLLNISPDEVIQAFNELGLSEEPAVQFQVPLFKTQSNTLDRYIRLMTYGLAGVLVILFLMWWQTARKPITTNPTSELQTVSANSAVSTVNTVNSAAVNTTENTVGTISNNRTQTSDENAAEKTAKSTQQDVISLALPTTQSSAVKQETKDSKSLAASSPESLTANPSTPPVTPTNPTVNVAATTDASNTLANTKVSKPAEKVSINTPTKKMNKASGVSGATTDSSALINETQFPPNNNVAANKTGTRATNLSASTKASGQKKSSLVLSTPFE